MLRDLLQNSTAFLEQALCIIYAYQTIDEKVRDATRVRNGIGFNRPDAGPLSIYARRILDRRHLWGKSLVDAQNRMPKYAGQLIQSAEIQSIFQDTKPTEQTILNAEEWYKKPAQFLMGHLVHETERALLIYFDEEEREIWVPKSQIFSRIANKYFLIADWFVKKDIKPQYLLGSYV